MKKRCVIAILDDHPMVLEGLQQIIKGNLAGVSVHGFPTVALLNDFMARESIDLLLVDIFLSDCRGIDVCREVKTKFPGVFVLGMSSTLEKSTIVDLLQQGASGFILKNAGATEVLDAIQKVMKGEIVLSPEANSLLLRSIANPQQFPALTRRERELLNYLSKGKTTAEISDILHLSKFTIDTYRKNLLQKFQVRNTVELLAMLSRENLL
ncbi:response regulator [Sphingobacterium suaedae]|uniref:Response regulator n=1 Tax=Sphingobacterium suaedae TaxID=1686402 RepID=A0ABW5KFR6_9SPHI